MKITDDFLIAKRLHLLILPEILTLAESFTDDDLLSGPTRSKFFDQVELLMLKYNPYRSAMGSSRVSFAPMAPIMNKIDSVLAALLSEIEKAQTAAPIKEELLQEYYQTFLRAANLYHAFITEMAINTNKDIDKDYIITSYLEHLIRFLLYCKKPLIILRVAIIVTKFTTKFRRLSAKVDVQVFLQFMRFLQPFLRCFANQNFDFELLFHSLEQIESDSSDTNQLYLKNLLRGFSEEKLSKLLPSKEETANKPLPASIGESNFQSFEAAGERVLLNLLAGKCAHSFEIAGLIAGAHILYVGMTRSEEISKNADYGESLSELHEQMKNVPPKNLAFFIPKIANELEKIKGVAQNNEHEAIIQLQAIELLLYSSHKALALWDEREQELENVRNSLKTSLADSQSSTFTQILTSLDEMIFITPKNADDLVAYLDSFHNFSVQHASLECYRILLRFVKWILEASEKDYGIYFGQTSAVVQKRLESLELDSYSTTLLPNYMSQVQLIATANVTEEVVKFSDFVSRRCFSLSQEIIENEKIDKLLNESPRSKFAKNQLVSYYMGHFEGLWKSIEEEGFWRLPDNPTVTVAINKEEYRKIVTLEGILMNFFGLEQEENLRKKEMISFLFFMQVGHLLTLELKNESSVIGEDDAQALAKLMSEYYDRNNVDTRFLFALFHLLRNNPNHWLSKVLDESTFVKDTQLIDIWFGDKLYEFDCGASLPAEGKRRTLLQFPEWWLTVMPAQHFDLRCYNASQPGNDQDLTGEGKNDTIKSRLLKIISITKGHVEKFNEQVMDVLQGKASALTLGILQRRIEAQLQIYPDMLTATRNYLTEGSKSEIARELSNLISKDFALIEIPDPRFNEAIKKYQNSYASYWNAESYYEVLSIIKNLDDKAIRAFRYPNLLKTVDRKDMELFGRLNYYARRFEFTLANKSEIKSEAIAEIKEELKKIQEDNRFNPEEILSAMYRLIRYNSEKTCQTKLFCNFPMYSFSSDKPQDNEKYKPSCLVNFLALGLKCSNKNSKDDLRSRTIKSFEQPLTQQIAQLKFSVEKLQSNQIVEGLKNLGAWVALLIDIYESIGKKPSDCPWDAPKNRNAVIGLCQNINVLEKIVEVAQLLQAVNFQTHIENSKEALKGAGIILAKCAYLIGKVKELAFNFDFVKELAQVYEKDGISHEQQSQMLKRIAMISYRLFLQLDLLVYGENVDSGWDINYAFDLLEKAELTVLEVARPAEPKNLEEEGKKENGSDEPALKNEEEKAIESEAKQAIKGDKTEPEKQSEELEIETNKLQPMEETNKIPEVDKVETVERSEAVQPQEKDEFTEESLKKINSSAWSEFLLENYQPLIRQIIVACKYTNRERFGVLKQTIKAGFFEFLLVKSQGFKEFLITLHQEAYSLFAKLDSVPLEEIAQLTTQNLPQIKLFENDGANTILSAALYYRFHDTFSKEFPESITKAELLKPLDEAFFDSQFSILTKLRALLEKEREGEQWKGSIPEIFYMIISKPSEARVNIHCEIYNSSENQLQEEHQKKLDRLFNGAKEIIKNAHLCPERVITIECLNLLAVAAWDNSYAERIFKEGLFEEMIKLPSSAILEVLPYLAEILIGPRIPPETRIEIALKAALLRSSTVQALRNQEALQGLKVLMHAYPRLFEKKYHEIFELEQTGAGAIIEEEEKQITTEKSEGSKPKTPITLNDYRVKIREGRDFEKLDKTGEYIPDYLIKAADNPAKTIMEALITEAVAFTENFWRGKLSNANLSVQKILEEEDSKTKLDILDKKFILISILLRKYPELRTLAAEFKVKTNLLDPKTFLIIELEEAREVTFLDYALYLLQALAYPHYSGLLISFFERSTASYVLEKEGELITSHEYFADVVIQKSLLALSTLLKNKNIGTLRLHQFQFAYIQTVRNALRSNWLSSEYWSRYTLTVLKKTEAIINECTAEGRSFNDLLILVEFLQMQTHEQIIRAFMQLDPSGAMGVFPTFEEEWFSAEEYNFIRTIIHEDRNYNKLNAYLMKQAGQEQKHRKSTTERIAKSEIKDDAGEFIASSKDDFDRKALLVRAIIEGVNLDYPFVCNMGTSYFTVGSNVQHDSDIHETLWPEFKPKKVAQWEILYHFSEKTKSQKDKQWNKTVFGRTTLTEEKVFKSPTKFTRAIEIVTEQPFKTFEDVIKSANQLQGIKKKSRLGGHRESYANTLANIILDKFENAHNFDAEDESDDAYGRLFQGLKNSSISKLRSRIEREIENIIDKKLVESFVSTASQKGKIQEVCLNKADPELNRYILSLKTLLEKKIALLCVNQAHVDMLSKTHQELRRQYINRFSAYSENAKEWCRNFDFDEEDDDAGSEEEDAGSEEDDKSDQYEESNNEEEEKKTDAEPSQEGAQVSEQRENSENLEEKHNSEEGKKLEEKKTEENVDKKKRNKYEVKIKAEKEKFEGFFKESAFLSTIPEPKDDQFGFIEEPNRLTKSEKLKMCRNIADFYLSHRDRLDIVHGYLFVASHELIERLVFTLFQENNRQSFLSLYSVLAANPLNELRLIDGIIAFLSINLHEERTLKKFNEYFKTAIIPEELNQKLIDFNDNLIETINEYFEHAINGKSAFELTNFEQVLKSAEKMLGELPMKKFFQEQVAGTSVGSPLVYILKKMFAIGFSDESYILKVADILKNGILEGSTFWDLQPSERLLEAIEWMSHFRKQAEEQPVIYINNIIANSLEDDEIFVRFLNSLSTFDPAIDLANQVFSTCVPELKKFQQKGADAHPDFFKALNSLEKCKALTEVQTVLSLVAKFSELIAHRDLKDFAGEETATVFLNLTESLSTLLCNKSLKGLYLNLIQTFELSSAFEKNLEEGSQAEGFLKQMLDLTLDIYRIFKVELIVQEKMDKAKTLSQNTLENLASSHPKTGTGRLAAKIDLGDSSHDLPSLGMERSFSQIRESGIIKFEELIVRLSYKAKSLIHTIVERSLPTSNVEKLAIAIKNGIEFYNQFPWLLSFDKKVELLHHFIEKERGPNYEEQLNNDPALDLKYQIRRKYIVSDSKRQLELHLKQYPRTKISLIEFRVEFFQEEGNDAGGLRNEWLHLLCKELFNPQFGLFCYSENRTSVQPDPKSRIIPDYLSYFTFAGNMIGYAIVEQLTVPINFTRSFLKLLMNRELSLSDLSDVDQQLMRSLDWMLKNPIEGLLDQEFTYEFDFFGKRNVVNIFEPGEKLGKTVTDQNKKEYVHRIIYNRLIKEIEGPLNAFKEGFYKFVSPEYLKLFSATELDKLIAGEPTIDVQEMKNTAIYEGYDEDSEQIVWFWEAVSTFDQEMLSSLWFFVTGLSRVGPGGFKNQPLRIANCGASDENLPRSHTCFATIDLPEYSTKEILIDKLVLAISEGKEGFGMV